MEYLSFVLGSFLCKHLQNLESWISTNPPPFGSISMQSWTTGKKHEEEYCKLLVIYQKSTWLLVESLPFRKVGGLPQDLQVLFFFHIISDSGCGSKLNCVKISFLNLSFLLDRLSAFDSLKRSTEESLTEYLFILQVFFRTAKKWITFIEVLQPIE